MGVGGFYMGVSSITDVTKWGMTDKTKLGFVYLFLSVGKRLTDSNYQLFEEVGMSLKGYSGMRGDIIGECEKVLAGTNDEASRLKKITAYFSTNNAIRQREILWLLISLINQMKIKSDNHQKFIDLWIEENKIDESIVLEMHDTYQTQHAMTEFDEWFKAKKDISYSEGSSINEGVKKNLADLEQSLNTLIALG